MCGMKSIYSVRACLNRMSEDISETGHEDKYFGKWLANVWQTFAKRLPRKALTYSRIFRIISING